MRKSAFPILLVLFFSFPFLTQVKAVELIDPKEISLQESYTVYKNDVLTIVPYLTPENATTNLKWISSDDSIVEVHSSGNGYSGNLIGISPGQATVTVVTSNNLSATSTIIVEDSISPTSISIPKAITLRLGESQYIDVTTEPVNSYCRFDISSSDSAIVSTYTGGSHTSVGIHANKIGTALITVYTNNGLEATAQIVVIDSDLPVDIRIPNNIVVYEGQQYDFAPLFDPPDSVDVFHISSSNEAIVRVATTGGQRGFRIYGVSAGNADVTVYTESGLSATGHIIVDHDWDAGAIKKYPTLLTDGQKEYRCKVCGEMKILDIDRLSISSADGKFDGHNIGWSYQGDGIISITGNIETYNVYVACYNECGKIIHVSICNGDTRLAQLDKAPNTIKLFLLSDDYFLPITSPIILCVE